MKCGACNKYCKDGVATISCSKCLVYYHTLCLNMNRDDIKSFRANQHFLCPNCKIKDKNINSDSTPVRSKQQEDSAVDQDDDKFMATTKKLASFEMPAECMALITAALNELRDTFVSMKNEMQEFTKSLNYSSDEIALFRHKLTDFKQQLKEVESYKAEVSCLKAEVAELRQIISSKEQRQLLKDVEISGIPESKSENLNQIVNMIAVKTGVELDARDIDDVRRVGARGSSGGVERRARPIVLTLTRRSPRDQLLRAARARRGLTTDLLEIPGGVKRVYLNEHLTKDNRVLFSKARKLGTELRFKYVWTSNGSIFMRRSETSSVLQVSSESVLDKLKAQLKPVELVSINS